mmetsp:Transcript_26451/g.30351  ORF Transcript_26451/g.30351 Transcript_26451/m.30351 type:complete len:337 (-) Transcript_26451:427-1437(-)|eukprot:CAMPEP_0114991938 /NCGR_PEP_ID=MMETSP0216-20121206/11660_1 /TAXON_ID=223996 /ORGANISM="Protocruzia adherens, Strain Boccale" /LENGTH=336 /DNA_ID=CAMNT_0002355341 /DNA_START=1617 /DNA_END=2627 /DNA_ORIENTATION=+
MNNLTLDVIGRCAFGSSYSSVEIDGKTTKLTDFSKQLESEVADYVSKLSFFLFPKKFDLNIDACSQSLKSKSQALRRVGRKIIKDRIELLKEDPSNLEHNPDLLNLMIRSHLDGRNINECDDLVDLDLLVDECVIFVLAGSETTSTLLTWLFFNLTKHPEVTFKLREELTEHFGDRLAENPEYLIDDYPALDKLPYLSKVINETLRIFPPAVAIMPKLAIKSFKLGDLTVHKGTRISVCPFLLHRSPHHWKNPHEFNPERSEFDKKDLRFLPFSAGKRSCIGQYFAQMEAKIAITKFVLAMNVECDRESDKRMGSRITLYVKDGMPAKLSIRHQHT